MTISQEFLKEVEAEFTASRRLIERVPGDNGRWKPHAKSGESMRCVTPSTILSIIAAR
jgi:hypothetical protein